MKARFPVLLSIALVCVSSASFTAAPPKSIPVVSSFAGSGDEPHTIRSDGGPYYHTAKGTSGVESHVQEGGAYELDVYYFTSDRKLSFDLNNLVPGTGTAAAPTGVIVTKGRLITKCSATQHLLNMNPSQPLDTCALHGRFDYYGRTMLVRMGGAEFPGTKNVRVSCTGVNPANPSQCQNWRLQTCSGEDGSGQCTQWGFDPQNPEAFNPQANVMTILEEKSAKGKVTTSKLGDYYMHLDIVAVKQ